MQSKTVYSPTFEEEAAFCRRDLSAFIEKTFKIVSPGDKYSHNWHLEAISEFLMACTRREIKRGIINIPPRSLKSISCSVAWPAWLLGHNPAEKIMCASYSGALAIKHSVDCRFMIEHPWYQKTFPNTRIAGDSNTKSKYITTARGHRIATSVGGTATGEGGDILIVDDPHSASDAQSKAIRTSQIDWFRQSFSTRLNDKENGVILVIMQRLHEKDLTGELLPDGGWEHLCLPAENRSNRIISIGNFEKNWKDGELLHPDRESKATLDKTKRELGSYAYAGQYLMQPAPEGGGLFRSDTIKLFNTNLDLPKFECIIQSYDTAMTDTTSADQTAFTVWGIFDKGKGNFGVMLLDCWAERLTYPDLRKKAAKEYQTRYGAGEGRKADFLLIEEKGSGISLIQDMNRVGIPVRKYNPGRADKFSRATLITYLFENGLVYFPESERHKGKFCSWTDDLVSQLELFPNGEHDDYVDSTTQALRFLRDANWLSVPEDPEEDYQEPEEYINPYTR